MKINVINMALISLSLVLLSCSKEDPQAMKIIDPNGNSTVIKYMVTAPESCSPMEFTYLTTAGHKTIVLTKGYTEIEDNVTTGFKVQAYVKNTSTCKTPSCELEVTLNGVSKDHVENVVEVGDILAVNFTVD